MNQVVEDSIRRARRRSSSTSGLGGHSASDTKIFQLEDIDSEDEDSLEDMREDNNDNEEDNSGIFGFNSNSNRGFLSSGVEVFSFRFCTIMLLVSTLATQMIFH